MKKILVNFNWIFISSIIFGFSQFIILSILNKFSSIEIVGSYVIAISLITPIFILLNMNISIIQITDQTMKYNFSSFYFFRMITSFLAILSVILLLVLLNDEIYDWKIVLLICFWKFLESQIEIFYGKYQNNENMNYMAYSKIARSTVNIIGILIGIIVFDNFYTSLIIVIATTSFLLIIEQKLNNFILLKEFSSFQALNKKILFSLFLTSIPLALSNFLDSLSINSQRLLMGEFLTIEAVGYYASMTALMLAGNTVFVALGRAFLPSLSRLFITDIKKYIKLTIYMYIIGIILSLLILSFIYLYGNSILTIIYTTEYSKYTKEFLLIMIAGAIWYSSGFLNIAIYATKNFNNQLIVYVVTFIVIVSSTYISLKEFGTIKAVAITLIIGMLVKKIILMLVLAYISKKEVIKNEKK